MVGCIYIYTRKCRLEADITRVCFCRDQRQTRIPSSVFWQGAIYTGPCSSLTDSGIPCRRVCPAAWAHVPSPFPLCSRDRTRTREQIMCHHHSLYIPTVGYLSIYSRLSRIPAIHISNTAAGMASSSSVRSREKRQHLPLIMCPVPFSIIAMSRRNVQTPRNRTSRI